MNDLPEDFINYVRKMIDSQEKVRELWGIHKEKVKYEQKSFDNY